jgi:hypothetical protein
MTLRSGFDPDEFYSHRNCPCCKGDGVSPNLVRPLPPWTDIYPPCPACFGYGKERIPLMWVHPLLASRFEQWSQPAAECPVVLGCVVFVGHHTQVVFRALPAASFQVHREDKRPGRKLAKRSDLPDWFRFVSGPGFPPSKSAQK